VDEVTGIKSADGIWARIDRIVGPFFSPKSRKYISFQWMTLLALCLFAVNLALRLVIADSKDRNRFLAAERFFHQPLFIIPYDIVLFVVLLLVFASKTSPDYDYLRAIVFGMALAAILGQILIFLVPW